MVWKSPYSPPDAAGPYGTGPESNDSDQQSSQSNSNSQSDKAAVTALHSSSESATAGVSSYASGAVNLGRAARAASAGSRAAAVGSHQMTNALGAAFKAVTGIANAIAVVSVPIANALIGASMTVGPFVVLAALGAVGIHAATDVDKFAGVLHQPGVELEVVSLIDKGLAYISGQSQVQALDTVAEHASDIHTIVTDTLTHHAAVAEASTQAPEHHDSQAQPDPVPVTPEPPADPVEPDPPSPPDPPPVNTAPEITGIDLTHIAENVAGVAHVTIHDAEDGDIVLDLPIAPQDFETTPAITLHASYTDSGGITVERDFTVTIDDVDETAPNLPAVFQSAEAIARHVTLAFPSDIWSPYSVTGDVTSKTVTFSNHDPTSSDTHDLITATIRIADLGYVPKVSATTTGIGTIVNLTAYSDHIDVRIDDTHPGGGDNYRINLTLTDPVHMTGDGALVITDGYASVLKTAWADPEDGTISGTVSIGPLSYDPAGNNTHTVTASATDSGGITVTHDFQVIVDPLPGQPLETFSGLNDFDGWHVDYGRTDWLSSYLSIGRGTNAPSSISKTVSLTAGETYTLSWDGNNANGGSVYTVTIGSDGHTYNDAPGWKHHEVQFIATGAEKVSFATFASSDSDALIDNIAVTPLHHA